MPLNQPKTWEFTPAPVGEARLITRSSTRARLYVGGSFFRSYERGEQANQIQIGIFEDGDEGICVVKHNVLKPSEQVIGTGVELFKLNIQFNEEIRIHKVGNEWWATNTGIRWQIAPGPVPAPTDLGIVHEGLFTAPGVSFKVTDLVNWSADKVVYLRPRTRRYTLVQHSVTDKTTSVSTKGWDPEALRATLNADSTGFVYMPRRPSAAGLVPSDGEDVQDGEIDADFITAVSMTNMNGGNGLPTIPVGLNTGPDRVMVHLNYAEQENGSMGIVNQIFEWQGSSATVGSWERY